MESADSCHMWDAEPPARDNILDEDEESRLAQNQPWNAETVACDAAAARSKSYAGVVTSNVARAKSKPNHSRTQSVKVLNKAKWVGTM